MSDKLYRCIPSQNNLVGVEFTNEKINVYFPLGYDIDGFENDDIEKSEILNVIRTVSLCKNNDTDCDYDYNHGCNDEIPINSYLWLLNDYLNNGLYCVNEKKYMISQKGKINWKKTFSTQPYFSNNEIIYLNPIIEYSSKTDNIITEIHAKCINICIKRIGWLFGNFELLEQYGFDISESCKKNYIDVLRKELSVSFNDKKKILLNHLIRILSDKSSFENNDFLNNMLVSNYNHAWEVMVRDVFGNIPNLDKFFPDIIWNLKYSKNPKRTMRPDSVICSNDKLYIVDAKYYKYGIVGNGELPGAEDVDKQITYGEYNSKKEEYSDVYNAFVMPYNKTCNVFDFNTNIVEVGNVTSDARLLNDVLENYKKIAIILVDTKFLLDLFCNNDKNNESVTLDLVKNIEEAIKYKKED